MGSDQQARFFRGSVGLDGPALEKWAAECDRLDAEDAKANEGKRVAPRSVIAARAAAAAAIILCLVLGDIVAHEPEDPDTDPQEPPSCWDGGPPPCP
jgi:hypothetical protein